MTKIMPIQTIYKGYKFRSRLEARWAVFFETLNMAWEYEKEGFDIDGKYYLPDFYIPSLNIYLEIKPGDPEEWPDNAMWKNIDWDKYIRWTTINCTYISSY